MKKVATRKVGNSTPSAPRCWATHTLQGFSTVRRLVYPCQVAALQCPCLYRAVSLCAQRERVPGLRHPPYWIKLVIILTGSFGVWKYLPSSCQRLSRQQLEQLRGSCFSHGQEQVSHRASVEGWKDKLPNLLTHKMECVPTDSDLNIVSIRLMRSNTLTQKKLRS